MIAMVEKGKRTRGKRWIGEKKRGARCNSAC
jgi:hypothetical protein